MFGAERCSFLNVFGNVFVFVHVCARVRARSLMFVFAFVFGAAADRVRVRVQTDVRVCFRLGPFDCERLLGCGRLAKGSWAAWLAGWLAGWLLAYWVTCLLADRLP